MVDDGENMIQYHVFTTFYSHSELALNRGYWGGMFDNAAIES